jgi:hypothetical protein
MGKPADSPVQPSRSTARALLLLLESLDRRDRTTLARRLVERVVADACEALPDDDQQKGIATSGGSEP